MQILQKNFLWTPLTTYKKFLTPYTLLTYSPTQLSEMQRQELELAGDIGKHSQSQRNYEQNLAEMTPELWRVSDCEELSGSYSQEKDLRASSGSLSLSYINSVYRKKLNYINTFYQLP